MWDERYQNGALPYGTEPSHYLREHLHRIRPSGSVLVPGDGGGRNGVWLARQGLAVEIWDYSAEGLKAAQSWADASGVAVATRQTDLTVTAWPSAAYDAVVCVYVHLPGAHRARVHRAMLAALKPGGVLIVEGFHLDQMAYASGGPRDPDMLVTEEIFRHEVEGFQIVDLRRDEVMLDESPLHRGPAVLLRAVVQA